MNTPRALAGFFKRLFGKQTKQTATVPLTASKTQRVLDAIKPTMKRNKVSGHKFHFGTFSPCKPIN